jgi:hypothetical protein
VERAKGPAAHYGSLGGTSFAENALWLYMQKGV